MDKRLYEAAIKGDAAILSEIIQNDPHLIDATHLSCDDKNVLHISAMLGHKEFMQAILQHNVSSSYDMCLARDREGRNPMHLAAIHGKLNILSLIDVDERLMQAARERVDKGGTILHLCVKHNQLDALKLLLKSSTLGNDGDFRRAKNDDGMNILHLAFEYYQYERRREIIIYLTNLPKRRGLVNGINASGKTALDLFMKKSKMSKTEYKRFGHDNESYVLTSQGIIHRSLLSVPAFTGDVISRFVSENLFKYIEMSKDAIMIVATIIATMAFQSMISPPGGVWQDNKPHDPEYPHTIGESVLAQTHPMLYRQLIRSNTTAFVSSLTTILVLLMRQPTNDVHSLLMFLLLLFAMGMSVTSISVTYAISFVAVAPKSTRGHLGDSHEIAIIVIMVWGFPLISFFYRMILAIIDCRRVSGRTHNALRAMRDKFRWA